MLKKSAKQSATRGCRGREERFESVPGNSQTWTQWSSFNERRNMKATYMRRARKVYNLLCNYFLVSLLASLWYRCCRFSTIEPTSEENEVLIAKWWRVRPVWSMPHGAMNAPFRAIQISPSKTHQRPRASSKRELLISFAWLSEASKCARDKRKSEDELQTPNGNSEWNWLKTGCLAAKLFPIVR